MRTLANRAQNIQILKAEGPAPYISGLMLELGGDFTVFNGRNGVELIDNLRVGCAGTIPGVECCDLQVQIYNSWRNGDHSAARAQFRHVLPLLSYLMLTIDHLLCYGKRLAAQRLGIAQVHDRQPAMTARAVDLDTLEYWSRHLESLPE
jgi:4-hydroxy-tetrahydrodipicolinate synthase